MTHPNADKEDLSADPHDHTVDGSGDAATVPGQRAETEPQWCPGDELLPAERDLLRQAAAGMPLAYPCDDAVGLEDMRAWGPERTVRAAFLRDLLVEDHYPIHAKGVRVRGARILGALDLAYAHLRCPVELDACYLDSHDPVNLTAATVRGLRLIRCHLPAGLTADNLAVEHGLSLASSTINGRCDLRDAHIKRQLNLSDAQLNGTDEDGNALVADRATITGGAFLTAGFTAEGAIRLPGADVRGPLALSGAHLDGADEDGDALVADGVTVTGDVLLADGFTAAGAVRLPGSDIKGQLNLSGAHLNGTDRNGNALVADTLRVGGDMFLRSGFAARGTVSLSEAQVGGALLLVDARLGGRPVALRADGLRVGHELKWSPTVPVQGLVDLERAAVHRLDDEWGDERPEGHWPPPGLLRLDGFTYYGFGGRSRASLRQRLDWIRKSHTTDSPGGHSYQAQPYQQLAQVYRQTGQEAEAQQVAIARRTDLRKHGRLTPGKWVANWLLDVTIRHGYKPGRALWALLVLYLAAFGMLWHAQHQDGLIVPTRPASELTSAPTALDCSPDYPCYYPAGHAFDTVVPIISTGQADDWRIDSSAPAGVLYTAGGWALTILGWAFSTLAVLGFTGVVRRE